MFVPSGDDLFFFYLKCIILTEDLEPGLSQNYRHLLRVFFFLFTFKDLLVKHFPFTYDVPGQFRFEFSS